MADDCLREPALLAFAKAFGPAVAILGAVLAWLLNNFLRWLVWRLGERRRTYDLLKGLHAEIKVFSGNAAEDYWADPARAETFVRSMEESIGAEKTLAPYVVVYEDTIIFEEMKKSLTSLPGDLIDVIVSYYYQALALNRQLIDFRSEFFADMSRFRQSAALRNTFTLGKQASQTRQLALHEIERQLGLSERLDYAIRSASCIAALALMFLGAPYVVNRMEVAVSDTLIPAVEWASSCDAPKLDRSNIAPNGSNPNPKLQRP